MVPVDMTNMASKRTQAAWACAMAIALTAPAAAVDMSCNGVQSAQQQMLLNRNPAARGQYEATLRTFELKMDDLRQQAKVVEATIENRRNEHLRVLFEANPQRRLEIEAFIQQTRPDIYNGAVAGNAAALREFEQLSIGKLLEDKHLQMELETRLFRDGQFLLAKSQDLALQRESHQIEEGQRVITLSIPPKEAERVLVARSLSDRYIQSPALTPEQRATLSRATAESPTVRDLLAAVYAGERAKSRGTVELALQPAVSDSRLVFDNSAIGAVSEAVAVQRETIRRADAAGLKAGLDLTHLPHNSVPHDAGLRREVMSDKNLPLAKEAATVTAKAIQKIDHVERTYDSITRVIPPPPPTPQPVGSSGMKEWMTKTADAVKQASNTAKTVFILDGSNQAHRAE